jgi:hypothetical protein
VWDVLGLKLCSGVLEEIITEGSNNDVETLLSQFLGQRLSQTGASTSNQRPLGIVLLFQVLRLENEPGKDEGSWRAKKKIPKK